jgi:hypothetical protein
MARLLGRVVYRVALYRILGGEYAGSYNGRTEWGEDSLRRDYDSNFPYQDLGLEQRDIAQGTALVYAAGKAAERIWYRSQGLPESQASFGEHDETVIWARIKEAYGDRARDADRDQVVTAVEDLAVQLLQHPTCWRAVVAVAEALRAAVAGQPDEAILDEDDIKDTIGRALSASILK